MSWNLRIMKHGGEYPYFAVHEVFYNDFGLPWCWTQNPIEISGDSVEDLMGYLKMVVDDVLKYQDKVLDFDAEGFGSLGSSSFEDIIEDLELGNYHVMGQDHIHERGNLIEWDEVKQKYL